MRAFSWLLVGFAVVLTTPARADDAPGGGGGKKARIEARLREVRGGILRRDVGLDEAKAERLEAVMKKHAPERRKLQEQMKKHRQALRALVTSDSDDQKAYAEAIKGLRAAQKGLAALREKELDEMSKQLTPKQQAKLLGALESVRKRLKREIRREKRRHRWDDGPDF